MNNKINTEDQRCLERYMNDIKTYSPLNLNEVKTLVNIIHNNKDKINEARNKLMTHNLKYVVKLAIEYYKKMSYFKENISIMDLIQVGNISLINAINYYDPDKSSFANYARPIITRDIHNFVLSTVRFIRIPHEHYKYIQKCKEIDSFETMDNRELAKKLKISNNLTTLIKRDMLNGKKCYSHENLLNIIENIPDPNVKVFEEIESRQLRNYLLNNLRKLKPAYSRLIFAIFFEEIPIYKIALKNKVTRQCIHRTLLNALQKLKKIIQEGEKHGSK